MSLEKGCLGGYIYIATLKRNFSMFLHHAAPKVSTAAHHRGPPFGPNAAIACAGDAPTMPQKGYQAGFPYTGGAGSGRGKYVYPSGAVYEGEFMDDKMHGRGNYVYADGHVYEGEYKDDKMHGRGNYVYPNGNVYEGEFMDDNRLGQGKYVWADGHVYEGEWKDGKMHGRGKYS